MNYSLRDFLFDFYKEIAKQGQRYHIHQRCQNMRQAVAMLPEKQRKAALLKIDAYEYNQVQGFHQFISNATATKEVLKQLGF